MISNATPEYARRAGQATVAVRRNVPGVITAAQSKKNRERRIDERWRRDIDWACDLGFTPMESIAMMVEVCKMPKQRYS